MLEKSIMHLAAALDELKGRTDKLEERVNRNSQNSSKPPSSDAPFKKPKHIKKKSKRKRGGQKGHPGHQQQLLAPNKVFDVKPTQCDCGNSKFKNMKTFYTNQQIELPEIELDITHQVLHKGCCTKCGKMVSAKLPKDQSFGYGPRMSALIAELSGMQGTQPPGGSVISYSYWQSWIPCFFR